MLRTLCLAASTASVALALVPVDKPAVPVAVVPPLTRDTFLTHQNQLPGAMTCQWGALQEGGSPNFVHMKTVTFAKSAQFGVPKLGLWMPKHINGDHFFHANEGGREKMLIIVTIKAKC